MVVEYCLNAGLRVRGVLSPARFVNGKKTGIYALDLGSDERRLMASLFAAEVGGVQTGCWSFDADVLAWQNDCLSTAAPADLIIIDELGPMEFEGQKGLQSAFDVLKGGRYHMALVIIRPEYVDTFKNMAISPHEQEVIVIDDSNIKSMALALGERIKSYHQNSL